MITLKQAILMKDTAGFVSSVEKVEIKESLGRFADYLRFSSVKRNHNPFSDGLLILNSIQEPNFKEYVYLSNENSISRYSAKMFYDEDILEPLEKVSGLSLLEILNIAKEIPDLYGVLISNNSNIFINPLHPIVALSLIERNGRYNVKDSEDLSAVFYKIKEDKVKEFKKQPKIYDSSAIFTRVYEAFMNRITEISIIAENKPINEIAEEISMMSAYSIFQNSKTINTNDESQELRVDAETANESRIQEPTLSVLIPVHIMNKQFVVPYYGIIDVDEFDSSQMPKGTNITPMASANVSNRVTGQYGNICCGKESPNTFSGLRTTNHSNLNSPYNTDTLCTGWFHWVQDCIKESLDIYRRVKWIK